MTSIGGEWIAATIKGRLVESGWGAEIGFPGLVLDEDGDEIPGYVFSSPNLDQAWVELDAFEGEEYRRAEAMVATRGGQVVCAFVYVLRQSA